MKYLSFFLLFFVPALVPAQDALFIDTVPDFWQHSRSPNIKYIEVADQLVSTRMYFDAHETNIKAEYFPVSRHKYLYMEYDSVSHDLIRQGTMVMTTTVVSYDTLVTFDPETYQEHMYIYANTRLEKDGFWLDGHSSGQYKTGVKTGEWLIHTPRSEDACYEVYSAEGKLQYTQPVNLLRLSTPDSVRAALQGWWNLIYQSGNLLRWSHADARQSGKCQLQIGPVEAQYFPYATCGNILQTANIQRRKWQFDQTTHTFTLESSNGGAPLRFLITRITRDNLIMEILE